jgi:hypothetical protein
MDIVGRRAQLRIAAPALVPPLRYNGPHLRIRGAPRASANRGGMEKREELLRRVAADAQSIIDLTRHGLNFPIDKYLDETSLNALCDAMGMEPDDWGAEDLEKILILREGLYDLRHDLRDRGDDAEHSVDRILGALDRLYADLERALRELGKHELQGAQQHLARLREGPRVSSDAFQAPVQNLQQAATELLTQTHITQRTIEVNIFRVDQLNVSLDVLRNAKLNVQRLSASVFAIQVSLQQSVIFQGIFRFLNEGADKVLADLKSLARQIQQAYAEAKDFLAQLSKLSETGGRFTRLVSSFLRQIFGDQPMPERSIELKQQTSLQGDALLSATRIDDKLILLGGRRGAFNLLDITTMRFVDQSRRGRDNINAVSYLDEGLVALGRDEGLELAAALGARSRLNRAAYREQVLAVECIDWGATGSAGAIVTGSRDGHLRRWTMAANLSQEKEVKVGRQIQRLRAFGEEMLVATGEEIVLVGEDMEIARRIHLHFRINDFDIVDDDTLVVCGRGSIAHVNFAQGIFSRLISASANVEYTSVADLTDNCVCVGTEAGKLLAIDFNSGHEIGSVDLGFPIRGIVPLNRRILAFGGEWNGTGKCAAFVTWKEQILAPETIG